MNRTLEVLGLIWVFLSLAPATAADWKDLSGKSGEPQIVAFSDSKTQPDALSFIPERMLKAGFWTSFTDAPVVAKIAQTATKSDGSVFWRETGLWMHLRTGQDWTSLPVYETVGAAAGAVKAGAFRETTDHASARTATSSRG